MSTDQAGSAEETSTGGLSSLQAAKCNLKASSSLQEEPAPSSLAHRHGPNSQHPFPFDHLRVLPARGEAGNWLCNVLLALARFRASPGTHGLPQPASPLLFYLRICCQNSNELSILRPVIFPPRPCRRLTQGPVATVRRKEDSERILFNFSFLSVSSRPPPLRCPLQPRGLPQPPRPSFAPLCYTIAQIEAQEGPIGNA